MVAVETLSFAALLTNALLIEWDLKTVVSTPALDNTCFKYLLRVSLETFLNGQVANKSEHTSQPHYSDECRFVEPASKGCYVFFLSGKH